MVKTSVKTHFCWWEFESEVSKFSSAMEVLASLSEKLQPFKDLMAISISVLTICHMLTPILLLNDIKRKKSSQGVSVVPFLGRCILWVFRSKIEDQLIIFSSSQSCAVDSVWSKVGRSYNDECQYRLFSVEHRKL